MLLYIMSNPYSKKDKYRNVRVPVPVHETRSLSKQFEILEEGSKKGRKPKQAIETHKQEVIDRLITDARNLKLNQEQEINDLAQGKVPVSGLVNVKNQAAKAQALAAEQQLKKYPMRWKQLDDAQRLVKYPDFTDRLQESGKPADRTNWKKGPDKPDNPGRDTRYAISLGTAPSQPSLEYRKRA